MTTAAKMIKYLQTLPADTVLECGIMKDIGTDTFMTMSPVNLKFCHLISYTSEEDKEKYPNMAGKTILHINA